LADYTIIYVLVGLSGVQAALTMAAAFFAYKITKAVGVFWAWGLIVAAFAVNAIQNVMSVISVFNYPPDQLNALLAQFSAVQIWSGQAISIVTATLLAGGMFGLLKIFSRPRAAETVAPHTSDP
jgi:membrane associated rhomboid family serine protease